VNWNASQVCIGYNYNPRNTMTVHWLSVRRWARHLRKCAEQKKLEVAIALEVRSMIIMAAATPIPVDLSEWLFAGLYGGSGVAKCKTVDLEVADSEFVLESTITPGSATDGPFEITWVITACGEIRPWFFTV